MSCYIQAYRKKRRERGGYKNNWIVFIFIRYVQCKWFVLVLSHWMAVWLGQTGGGGGLAFLLPKDSFKASFLHHCGAERERHIFICAAAAAERRRRAVSDFTSLTADIEWLYVLKGLAFQAFRWMHWVRRCFMIVVHVCTILDWSWKQLYY